MQASLYDRLGGATGIGAIVEDVVAAHLATNPVVQARWTSTGSTRQRGRTC
jgi:hypothetical protein